MIESSEPISSFKSPIPSPYSGRFWEGLRRHAFVVQRCEECGSISHPCGPVCKSCMSDRLAWVELSGEGEVYTYTVVHRAMHPEFEADLPFVLAYVRLDEGPTVVSWLRDVDPASTELIGLRVRATYEKIDERVTLHRFVPIETNGATSSRSTQETVG